MNKLCLRIRMLREGGQKLTAILAIVLAVAPDRSYEINL